jgi:hypothetical protein
MRVCFYSGVIEDSGLLGCDAVSMGRWLPTFRRNLSSSSSSVQGPLTCAAK